MAFVDRETRENQFRLAAVQTALDEPIVFLVDRLEAVARHYQGKFPDEIQAAVVQLRTEEADTSDKIVTWLRSEVARMTALNLDAQITNQPGSGIKPTKPGDGSNPSNPTPNKQTGVDGDSGNENNAQ